MMLMQVVMMNGDDSDVHNDRMINLSAVRCYCIITRCGWTGEETAWGSGVFGKKTGTKAF